MGTDSGDSELSPGVKMRTALNCGEPGRSPDNLPNVGIEAIPLWAVNRC